MKLHLGCGDIYLDGWINVDVKSPNTYLAKTNKEKADYNRTTIDDYYKYDYWKTKPTTTRNKKFTVVDEYWNLLEIPYPYDDDSIEEILIVGAFEHFSKEEGEELLREWYRILKPQGRLYIDIPDLYGTFKMFFDADTLEEMDWAVRLVYGSQKNKYSFHKWGYNFYTLSDICKEIGFRETEEVDIIKHEYPMFMLKAVK